jgi:glycosyltransferase involved in cell wall biosynthesis
MKVVHLNLVNPSEEMGKSRAGGIKRYEDELYENVRNLRPDIKLSRRTTEDIHRPRALIKNTAFSRLFRQDCTNIDIIHATCHKNSLEVFKKQAKKFVVTVHDLIPMMYPQEFRSSRVRDNLFFKTKWIFARLALRKADRIIAISKFTQSEITRLIGISKDKIDVIYQGVDHTRYRPMDKIECKRIFGLDPNDKHVLVVASNAQRKRMDLTKQVFDSVRLRRSDVGLLKAGYGENLIGDGIINVGQIPEKDMPKLFNAADIYLHTSEYEGFGLPVLEAMACGIPVVVSNKASLPEIVGEHGTIVDLETNDVVGQFSEKILHNLKCKSQEAAVEYVKNFSWQKSAEETIKLYEEVQSAR